MKKITQLFILFLSLGILSLGTLGCGEADPKSDREKPPILTSRVTWLDSHQEAVAQSKETGKPIFAFFTGSDWCKYCQLLDHQILNTEEFAKWSKENVVLLEIDFPRNKKLDPEVEKYNNSLARQYRVSGFPTVVFMASDGTPLLTAGYQQVPAEKWIEVVDKKLKESLSQHSSKPTKQPTEKPTK